MLLRKPRPEGGELMSPFEHLQHLFGHILAADIVGTFGQLLPDAVQSLTSCLIFGQLNGG